jgi:DNA-binding transcriptional MerR regulator
MAKSRQHTRRPGKKKPGRKTTSRIKELAKELGIHPITLREYFKLGCPQTSAEDIRKWREEYLKRPGAKQVYTPRIEELAKEAGVHPVLLRRYFKLGCPQTSVEGIKKWREEYLRRPGAKQIHTPRIKEFAKELGVHPVLLRKYFKLGCPQASVEDIKKWREEYLRRPGKKKPGRKPTPRIKELEMAKSRQHTTESKRDFRSRLESVLND